METGYAFKPQMIGTLVNHFNKKTFNQDGNDSAVLKMKYCDPLNPIFLTITTYEKKVKT